MSLLSELNALLEPIIPVETGVFSDAPPNAYAVLTPFSDTDVLFCDNRASFETQEVRISLYVKGPYTAIKNTVVLALRAAGLTITDKHYVGYESGNEYHHYAIDIMEAYTT